MLCGLTVKSDMIFPSVLLFSLTNCLQPSRLIHCALSLYALGPNVSNMMMHLSPPGLSSHHILYRALIMFSKSAASPFPSAREVIALQIVCIDSLPLGA